MNALASVTLGIFCYACASLILMHKIAGVSSLSSVPMYSSIVVVGVLAIRGLWQASGHEIATWNSSHLPWMVALGLLLVVADLAYVNAFNAKGASLPLITTVVSTMPLVTTALNAVIKQELPSMRTLFFMLLAVVVVWGVAYDPANAVREPVG